MAVEPGHSPGQEADRCRLLLVRQHFHVGQSCGVVDLNVHTVVADAGRAALLTVAGDAVADPVKAGQLPLLRRSLRLDVDVDQAARGLVLVALHWRFGLQIPQLPEPQAVQSSGHAGEGSRQPAGDVAHVQALMPELHGALEVLRIKRPPLGAGNTASICQCGCPTCAVAGQPLVGAALGDPRFGSQISQGAVVVQVLRNQSQLASLRQAGIGVCMHAA